MNLTKHGHHGITKHTPTAPTLKVKHVMLLDVGDAAFTDDSVKAKPHKSDPSKFVLKCTKRERLAAALLMAHLKPVGAPFKGNKHWIVIVWKTAFQQAILTSGAAQTALDAGGETTLTMPAHSYKALTKGGAK